MINALKKIRKETIKIFQIFRILLSIQYKIQVNTFQEKTDQILDILHDVAYKKHMRDIQIHYKGLLDNSSETLWSKQFHNNAMNFTSNLVAYEKQSLVSLFNHIYSTQCDENLDQLYEMYDYVITTRTMYLHIKVAYFNNYEDFTKAEKTEALTEELMNFSMNVEVIVDSITEVYTYFLAARTLHRNIPFHPGKHQFSSPKVSKNCNQSIEDLKFSISWYFPESLCHKVNF